MEGNKQKGKGGWWEGRKEAWREGEKKGGRNERKGGKRKKGKKHLETGSIFINSNVCLRPPRLWL